MAKLHQHICSLLLLVLIRSTVQNDDELKCPNNYTSTTTLMRLKRDMFCQYDRWIRPVKHQNDSVQVSIKLLVNRIDFNEKTDVLTTNSLFVVEWNDLHVNWTPSQYDNIDYVQVHSWYLWNPDLGILNAVDRTGYGPDLGTSKCLVYYSGSVVCVPPVKQTASCSADIKHWPYDVHTCNIVIGSWMHTGEELNLTILNPPIELRDFNMNREWDVARVEGVFSVSWFANNLTYPYVTFKFQLRRHSGSHAASVLLPAAVLMFITLMTYWMDATNSDRIFLTVLNIFAHFIFLQYLGYMLPSNGDVTPVVVTFFRDSLVLTLLAFMMAVIGRGLRSSSKPVPLWISAVMNIVFQSRIGQLIVLHNLDPKAVAASETSGGEGADLVNNSERSSTFGWDNFTSLLNFICFLLSLLTYLILLIGYLP
ncbi:hypothetical protein L9F63_003082 [Diploptera punctata]|uniref:Neurotransmitter-gated ion-channel ligand-binding domain-containing protein n=1 Tax=Diploptera punctata TaxID=6984 RepID=A0AAD8EC74_DIPPU|nr:hypothetical protein L9F63_003082 [Diploptera punctata]